MKSQVEINYARYFAGCLRRHEADRFTKHEQAEIAKMLKKYAVMLEKQQGA